MFKIIESFRELSDSDKRNSQIYKIVISFALVMVLLVSMVIGTWLNLNTLVSTWGEHKVVNELVTSLNSARINSLVYIKNDHIIEEDKVITSLKQSYELANKIEDQRAEKIKNLIKVYERGFIDFVETSKERKLLIKSMVPIIERINNNVKEVIGKGYDIQNTEILSIVNKLITNFSLVKQSTFLALVQNKRASSNLLDKNILYFNRMINDIQLASTSINDQELIEILTNLKGDIKSYNIMLNSLIENNIKIMLLESTTVPAVIEADNIVHNLLDENKKTFKKLEFVKNLIYILISLFFIGGLVQSFVTYQALIRLFSSLNQASISRDEALSATKVKSQFLANMSHEIRTPLNAIIGMNQLASNSDIRVKKDQYIHSVGKAAQSLLVIINDILDISKIESGAFNIEYERFSLPPLLEQLYDMMAAIAHKKDIEFEFIYQGDMPEYVLGDSIRLNQVLLNLLGNAIKFTEKGKVSLIVKCHSIDDGRAHIKFQVNDTGIGISEQDLDKLFFPFSQVDGATNRKYEGTGLGLMICKQLVELMGGQLDVVSTLAKGSQFSFEITLDSLSETEVAPMLVEDSFEVDLDGLKNKHILLAEDNKINQELIKAMLEGVTQLDICDDGEQAIDKLKHTDYDGILMDCQMPSLDGYQATEILRKELNCCLPIIAITANVMPADVKKAKDSGMNDVIAKPIDTKELYSKMVEWFVTDIPCNQSSEAVTLTKENYNLDSELPAWLQATSSIDHEAGLKVASGNKELYLKLLTLFAEEYQNTSLKAGEHQKVHLLKGTSGNLGAMTLYQACIDYESGLEPNALAELNMQLERVLNSLMPLVVPDKTLELQDKAFTSQDEVINSKDKPFDSQDDLSISYPTQENVMAKLIGHVLIVEDDLINQCLLKNQLKEIGLSSDVSNDGQEALEQLQNRRGVYDLILTDIHMPNVDGHCLAQEIKTNIEQYGYMNIIGCTGETDYALDSFPYFDALISKPLDSLTIYNCLSKFLIEPDPLSTQEVQSEITSKFSGYSHEDKLEICNVIVDSMSKDIEFLENSIEDLEPLAHKIKGAANMLGLKEIANLAQVLQNESDPKKLSAQKHELMIKMRKTIGEVEDLLKDLN